MLDRSGSVGPENHAIALQFISSVVSFFSISPNSSRVGMVAYSTDSQIQFDLNDRTTSQSLLAAISIVTFTGGATNTPAALIHAKLLLDPTNNRGARTDTLGIPKIAILITGKSLKAHWVPKFYFYKAVHNPLESVLKVDGITWKLRLVMHLPTTRLLVLMQLTYLTLQSPNLHQYPFPSPRATPEIDGTYVRT